MKAADGSMNLMEWDVGIPGKDGVSFLSLQSFLGRISFGDAFVDVFVLPAFFSENSCLWTHCRVNLLQTPWEGGLFKLVLSFPEGDASILLSHESTS
jgi:ubiquitin-protein ligase